MVARTQQCRTCRWFTANPHQPSVGMCHAEVPLPNAASASSWQRYQDQHLAHVNANGGKDCPVWALPSEKEKGKR